ncbi:MAG: (d)CMP kinase [Geminicoccaceae bacterium]
MSALSRAIPKTGAKEPVIVAIDGPAGSGKSTLALRLAAHYGLRLLDTGLLYRAVARRLLDEGIDPANEAAAVSAANGLGAGDLVLSRLRGEETGNGASVVAAMPAVRAALLPVQRRIGAEGRGRIVVGRDLGTVIFPETPHKFFVTASVEARARRRHEELLNRGEEPIYARVLDELKARDRRDEARAVAPLSVAVDATVVDTSELDIEQAFETVKSLMDERLGTSP